MPASAHVCESPLMPRFTCLSVPRCHCPRPTFRKRIVYAAVPSGASVGDAPWSTSWAWNANPRLDGATTDRTTVDPPTSSARITVTVTRRTNALASVRGLIVSAASYIYARDMESDTSSSRSLSAYIK